MTIGLKVPAVNYRPEEDIQEWSSNGFVDSVKVEEYEVPYSTFANIGTIRGRKKIKDYSKTLTPLLGIERVMTKGITVIPNEFGPNGEPVFEIANKESRIRFIGPWNNETDVYGHYQSGSADAFTEVTFYGTGLNLLTLGGGGTVDLRATIDNGTEGSNFVPVISSILATRKYSQNIVVPVVSELTLGWHTVKIRTDTTGMYVHGFEILNESTQLKISEGIGYSGCTKQTLTALSSTNYNAGVSGAKGARVIKYLKDGVIGQAVQEVDATDLYLASANHSNEEIIRKIHWNEFSANRADDFSPTLSGSRAFTLDDGSTTLVGSDLSYFIYQGRYGLGFSSDGFIVITFIGTGLDIDIDTGATVVATCSISVDGVVKDATWQPDVSSSKTYKICSGLPYGTHTVKIVRSASDSMQVAYVNFIIHQAKKPSLPVGAVEICDYNVMANFVANTVTLVDSLSTGVLRKSPTREMVYKGNNWAITGPAAVDKPCGFQLYSLGSTDGVMEYTFFGTGFEFRFRTASSYSSQIFVSLNETLMLASNFPTANFSTYGDASIGYDSATARLDIAGTDVPLAGFIAKDLPLGTYTVKFANTAVQEMPSFALDIITPIHVNNTMVGSLSLEDKRNFSPIPKEMTGIDLSKAKAWIYFNGVTNEIISSHNIAAVIDRGTGDYQIFFEKSFKDESYVTVLGSNSIEHALTDGWYKKNGFVFNSWNTAISPSDAAKVMAVCYGELENEGKE